MKKLLLIDANALVHRAFHALPPLTTENGKPVGAIYGMARMLFKVLRELKPDYVAAAFDRPEPTFRKEKFEAYKAHRPKAPDELISQIIEAHRLMEKLRIPLFEHPGYEADDVIGTLIKKLSGKKNLQSVILTGDLDTLQLVSGNRVVVQTPKKGVSELFLYNESAVRERFGVSPSQIADFKGLTGDASDNIPGVPGIGPKTAASVLQKYRTLDNLYAALQSQKTPAGISDVLKKKFLEYETQARFSRDLARIDSDVPIKANLGDLAFHSGENSELNAYFEKLGFKSLTVSPGKVHNPLPKIKRTPKRQQKRGLPLFVNPVRKPQRTSHSASAIQFPHLSARQAAKLSVLNGVKSDVPQTQETHPEPHEATAQRYEIFNLKNIAGKKKIAANPNILKVAYDWKPILKACAEKSITAVPPFFDVKIAGWLMDPDQKDYSLESLSRRFLDKSLSPGNEQETTAELYRLFTQKIREYGLTRVFYDIEMPLIPVLADMERAGIGISKPKLSALKEKVNSELKKLEEKIFEAAECRFNLNSPRQVGEILFSRLGIHGGKSKKTKTGQPATAEKRLRNLVNKHPIVPLILSYREMFKILSGFIKPLLEKAADDGRIHTTFSQTGTGTGRISSSHPNMQNIPRDSVWAQKIREAFVPSHGRSFLAFDYSQLELRLLAHVADDEKLKEAFLANQDIHALTASEVLGVPITKISAEERRLGKTLNFGIVYGMGARALSELTGFSLKEAQQYIERFFSRFPKIRKWQNQVKTEAITYGYVTNANGRRRLFLESSLHAARFRREAERAAVNMPIQSLEADILKLAMEKSFTFLLNEGLVPDSARLLLTVHDELLFEASDDKLKTIAGELKKIMENIYQLSVPLRVEVSAGKNWGEMHTLITSQ